MIIPYSSFTLSFAPQSRERRGTGRQGDSCDAQRRKKDGRNRLLMMKKARDRPRKIGEGKYRSKCEKRGQKFTLISERDKGKVQTRVIERSEFGES